MIRQKVVLSNGQSMGFSVPDGVHNIVLKIGSVNHRRTIQVVSANGPVRIHASWMGAPQIDIE